MSETPTIEAYEQYIRSEDFHAYKCAHCGAVIAPPSGVCYACGGTEMKWTKVSGKGTLISFTVIHVAPEEFQAEVPYFVAIVELEEGTRISARLKGFDAEHPETVKIGTPVVLDYEHGESGNIYLAFRPA